MTDKDYVHFTAEDFDTILVQDITKYDHGLFH
jgi:hypothetical protein